ncbi:hypothetical protein [Acinetobacter ursingii]|uniref:hypothetical protein n=1 Tax=Acinetobacter ursingii TaxID=108980 RepID=UPI00124EE8E6|nr:hypothetical protein [Acinetobacter ursingii]
MLELFAKLNPKTQKYTMPSSGVMMQDHYDLANVLAKLPEQHSWYIYAMIGQQVDKNIQKLEQYFFVKVINEMLLRRFEPRKMTPSDFTQGVVKAAITAHFKPKGKCKKCNGIGFIGSKICKHCDGTGRNEYSMSEKVLIGFDCEKLKLSRKWYQNSCMHYDSLIQSEIAIIRNDLVFELWNEIGDEYA